jgi:hypothetical protein
MERVGGKERGRGLRNRVYHTNNFPTGLNSIALHIRPPFPVLFFWLLFTPSTMLWLSIFHHVC